MTPVSRKSSYTALDDKSKARFERLKEFMVRMLQGSYVLTYTRTQDSDQTSIRFQPGLTAPERKQIHLMADVLNLKHGSDGEGDRRCILVWKPTATGRKPDEEVH